MYDRTFYLPRMLDDRIRRAAILIEQHQIHIAELDASHNDLIQSTRARGRRNPEASPDVSVAATGPHHSRAKRSASHSVSRSYSTSSWESEIERKANLRQ